MKMFAGIFLIAHGLIHASYLTPKPQDPKYPFDFTKGWFADLIGGLAKPTGTFLAILAIVSFIVAGLGVLGTPWLDSAWKFSASVGAVSSILLLSLFWHPWLILGFVINAVLLYGIYKLKWTFGVRS